MNEVPAEVVGLIRRHLRLPEGTMPIYASTRTAERHRNLVRARGEVVTTRRVPGRSPLTRSRRRPDGRMTRPLKIQSGKNAGKHPSVASLYRALAETDAQHLATRP